MWQRLDVERTLGEKGSALLVALSTMAPQYAPLYSHARELAKFLMQEAELTALATLYSSSLPAAVAIDGEGVARLQSNKFYSVGDTKGVLMLAGDGSPVDEQQEYAQTVLSFARQLGVEKVVSVGARWSESPLPAGATISPIGYSTDKDGVKDLEGYGVTITKGEPGPFFPNLVVGMAADYGMRGYKLGVDHGEPSPHPRSLIQIVGVLNKMLGMHVETKALAARAKEMERPVAEGFPEVPKERGGIYG